MQCSLRMSRMARRDFLVLLGIFCFPFIDSLRPFTSCSDSNGWRCIPLPGSKDNTVYSLEYDCKLLQDPQENQILNLWEESFTKELGISLPENPTTTLTVRNCNNLTIDFSCPLGTDENRGSLAILSLYHINHLDFAEAKGQTRHPTNLNLFNIGSMKLEEGNFWRETLTQGSQQTCQIVRHMVIKNSRIEYIGQRGLLLKDISILDMESTSVEFIASHGVEVSAKEGLRLRGVTFNDMQPNAVTLSSAVSVYILENYFKNGIYLNVSLSKTGFLEFDGNNVTMWGIGLAMKADHIFITKNRFRYIGDGVVSTIQPQKDITFSNNTLISMAPGATPLAWTLGASTINDNYIDCTCGNIHFINSSAEFLSNNYCLREKTKPLQAAVLGEDELCEGITYHEPISEPPKKDEEEEKFRTKLLMYMEDLERNSRLGYHTSRQVRIKVERLERKLDNLIEILKKEKK